MDFSSLETIVGKRKLPPSSENKKKRRRITPTLLPTTTAADVTATTTAAVSSSYTDPATITPYNANVANSTGKTSHQPGVPTKRMNYYYQHDNSPEKNVSSQYSDSIHIEPMQSSYDTSIGHFESTLMVKQKFYLSDTLYILIGLDISESFDPTMYIVDKKWWMQIQLYPECLSTIVYFKKRIDDFFASPRLCKEFHPIHVEKIKILPSKNSEPAIRLQRSRSAQQTIDWEDPEINAIFNFIEDRPVPEITMNREEWSNLILYSESINEYYQLCSSCKSAANRLMLQYIKDFKNAFRQIAVATNSQHHSEQARVKEEMRKQLPFQVRKHHYSRLSIESADNNQGIVSPFGVWLDAELRVFCNQLIASKVLNELSTEFTWLTN